MYSVTVRDSVLIAHSLKDPAFGPAQHLHGATFIVDLEFISDTINEQNVVIDIRKARQILSNALEPFAYQNLDEIDTLAGELTTAEFMARHIHDAALSSSQRHFDGSIRVRLGESHDVWVSYTQS